MSYKDNYNLQSKSWLIDENAAALCNLIKKLKINLAKLQRQQTFYHNKNIKARLYQLEKILW